MINKNFCFVFLIIINYFHNGESRNYYPYTNNILPQSSAAASATASSSQPQIEHHHHLLHGVAASDEAYNTQIAAGSYPVYQQNHAVSSETTPQAPHYNYEQFYRYNNEAIPLRQPPQPQPTQLWSGPPIVVGGDDMYLTSNIPQTTYNTPSTYNTPLLSVRRHSKALPVYSNQQQRSTTQQLNFDNNNSNIVYHRDFRHEIDALPATKGVHTNSPIYNQQQQQQFYGSITNTPFDYASASSSQQNFNLNNRQYESQGNYYASLRRDNNVIDYTDYFKRYLQNNPRRIQPLY